jgi:segregation and condensation protein B
VTGPEAPETPDAPAGKAPAPRKAAEPLDLAAIAARLAARSAAAPADPALEPQPPAPEPAPEAQEAPAPDAEPGAAEARAALAADEPSGEPGPEVTVAEPQLSGAEVFAAVEALLFAADRPLTVAQLARALPAGVGAREVRAQLKAIAEDLAGSERGFELREIAGGWQLLTREKFAPYVARLKRAAAAKKLSGPALETLAVAAYKQPVTRAEIERIRGVNCGDMLRSLLEKRLVRIAGRSSELGNPLLYGTTQEFLEHFGLKSIADLPRSAELSRKPAKPAAPGAPAAADAAPAGPAPGTPDHSDGPDLSDQSEPPAEAPAQP